MRRYRVIVTPWIGQQVFIYVEASNDVDAEREVEALWLERYGVSEHVAIHGEYSVHACHDYAYASEHQMPPLGVFEGTGTVDLQPK